MGDLSLRDRLRDHAEAFDGLLSLIPAKMYYGEDNSDQWKKKKQTKQEAAAARRGKLDPDSELNRNAKEVMDERAKNKRKLREIEPEEETGEEQDEDDTFEVPDGVEAERPGEGLKKKAAETTNKKQKLDGEAEEEEKEEEGANEEETGVQEPASHQGKLSKKEEKAAAKREKRKEKKAEKKSKAADAPPTPAKASAEDAPVTATPKSQTPKSKKQSKTADKKVSEAVDAQKSTADAPQTEAPKDVEDSNASAADSEPQSPTFDFNTPLDGAHDNSAEPASTTTSISSAVPPSEKPKHIKIPADTSALRARLAAKIEALRAARKADGPDGKPIRTRQELIEARRAKEAQRKEHKKELRKQARLEEERKREEALASNSPGVMSPAVELDEATGNFSFGRVAFGDGTQMSHDLSYVLTQNKKKGPSDPKTALLKVQNQKKRLQELDEEKQKDIAEKEAWLTARRRIEGEKIRDDETMLKKALKRKETAKKKSEKAWKERSQGVEQAQKARQKKREENIKKRREEKLLGKAGKKKKKGGVKKKGRPGFEGSLGVGGRKK